MASTTSSNHRFRRLAAIAAALLLWTAPASANAPTPADLATARALYLEAKELRAAGDTKAALEKYQGAWATAPTPIIGLELGRTHMLTGQLIEARETFLAVGRLPVESDETDRSAEARRDAANLAETLRPKIATLIVKINGAPESRPASLTIDGATVAVVSGTATRKINPGKHELVARVGASEQKESIELAEGETKQLGIELTVSPADLANPDTPSDGRSGGALKPVLFYGGLGLAGVGVVVGGVTGVMALGKASTVDSACVGQVCPESVRSDVDSGRTLATVSTIGFGAAVVGAAAAAIGFFVIPPRSEARGQLHRVTPKAAVLSGGALFGAEGVF